MSTPLLTTKLYIPPLRPALVLRPRLVERLNAGLNAACKLILVSAPAGFGKTTLLSEWIYSVETAEQTIPTLFAWLSLDKGDNDPTRFWAYVVAALREVRPNIGEAALTILQAPQPTTASTSHGQAEWIETILTDLINELAEAGPVPLVLVLDDLHLIENSQIHDELVFVLEHLPSHNHLVVSSRADPPWPLARWRTRCQITELRSADLRFTPAEAAAFLSSLELDLTLADVAALEERTEGWVAGLQMAAISMQARKQTHKAADLTGFIQAFKGSHHFVLDYLIEEVLNQQPPDVHQFLLQTSILERMSAPLCDAVTERTDSQAMLTRLERANLFLIPLDDQRRWYRYHHLFADLLRSRLEMRSDESPQVHRRASEWYERNGFVAEAVSHAFAGGDIERVARLAAANALALVDHGELTTLAQWLNALPSEVARTHPWLNIARAWVLAYTGPLDRIEALLSEAESTLPPSDRNPDERRIAGHAATIRSYIAWLRSEGKCCAEHARTALEQLPQDDMARGLAATTLGAALTSLGNLEQAVRASEQSLAICQAAGNTHVVMLAMSNHAYTLLLQGRLHEAAAACRQVLDMNEPRSNLPAAGSVYSILSAVLREWNDLDEAIRCARRGLELGERWGQTDTLTVNYGYLAGVLQAMGDLNGAADAIEKAKRVAQGLSPWFDALVLADKAHLHLARGEIAAASRWAQANESMLNGELVLSYCPVYLVLARTLIALNKLDEALRFLVRLLKMAEGAGARLYIVRILVLQAVVWQALGKRDKALTALSRAIELGEPAGMVRSFVDEGEAARVLIADLRWQIGKQERGIYGESRDSLLAYIDKLLGEFHKPGPVPSPPSEIRHPTSDIIEPLSERERQVLRLLGRGLSSTEIADELVISANTVRSHIKSIYGKLNVHQRTAALERAKELGLL